MSNASMTFRAIYFYAINGKHRASLVELFSNIGVLEKTSTMSLQLTPEILQKNQIVHEATNSLIYNKADTISDQK